MSDSARFALHRPQLQQPLERGAAKIKALMANTRTSVRAGEVLIEANMEHPWIYRLVSGWASRSRMLPDARDQCILVFLPGDLFAVKSMYVRRHMDDVVVLADSVLERTVRDGEVRIADLERLARIAFPLLDTYERRTPEYVGENR